MTNAGTWGQNDAMYDKFMELPQGDRVQAMYIWIGGSGQDLRSKTKTLPSKPESVKDLPGWNYDGSSTGQAPGTDSEVYLQPVKIFPDPFRRGDNILVLCETLHPLTMEPIPTNSRAKARRIFENKSVVEAKPWYGIEQEHTLFESDGVTPLGWPQFGYPGPQGPYYCSVGARRAYGRQVIEAHYRCCLYCGLDISGTNAEVMAGQWEYQIGPCEGIDSGDQIIISRYLLERVAESFQTVVSFHPKPIKGDWNGAGCHTNYSTEPMRQDGGYKEIIKAIERLSTKHQEHIDLYGLDNDQRLTGAHETASIKSFSYGVANRGASVRIPNQAKKDGKGYFEDRRPASNMDPYLVTAKIAETTILYDKAERPLIGESDEKSAGDL